MNYLYWIAVLICVTAFGGMTNKNGRYKKFDRIWVPLMVVSLITAIVLSGNIMIGIITGIVLFFGNGLLWGIVWGSPKGIRGGVNIQNIIKESEKNEH